jgi:hypothetical protein
LDVVGNDTVFIVAIHDPDDATPWTARSRWNGQVWTEFETNCAASDVSVEHPQDWECTVSTDYSALQPGAHRLEVQFYEEGQWTEEKIYYHTVLAPVADTSDGNNLPEIPVDTGSETFSIWIVFAIVIASIVGLIGLYMVITLSKDDMEEMLGRPSKAYDDSDESEIEIADMD